MVSRRRSLQFAGAAVAAALAGCSGDVLSDETSRKYALQIQRIATEPVPWALYEPPEDELFGDPARAALDAILPTGRHVTHGYTPISEGAYVEHDGQYYRIDQFVSGRAVLERPLVRVESVEEAPEEAVLLDSLEQPSARTVKILHSHVVTDGASASASLLRGDAYVMARPAERESRLVGELDGRVVRMTAEGELSYRIHVDREQVTLTEHTTLANAVADDREAFREVVLGSAVDADLGAIDLSEDARTLLDRAIERETYRETGEPSDAFETLLRRLGFAVDESETGRILWDGRSLFRASFYVNRTD
ncbi:hypothetical protein [Halolamina sediminis]|uniref:hypothetical protein n=1 Tax=Halolamina sediminis TaxID=1480675 RepID=UPI0006B49B58|nr:hypothetical protein [Halolamina sediminis]